LETILAGSPKVLVSSGVLAIHSTLFLPDSLLLFSKVFSEFNALRP
jgi:hypothetical protein